MIGISYIDVTSIAVCHPKRISRNKVFKGLAKLGKTTYDWFFGFIALLTIVRTGGENIFIAVVSQEASIVLL